MVARSGRHTVPPISSINQAHIGGCDDLLRAGRRRGAWIRYYKETHQ